MFSVLYGKCLPPPSRRFRPDEEDGAAEVKGELLAVLRLSSEKANPLVHP